MKTVVTHNGKFHADDVFAIATLQLVFGVENLTIVRTRDEGVIHDADIVVDVGMEHNPEKDRFDHHQKGGAGERENSIQYASFGLVWKKYGRGLTGSEAVWKYIDEKLVQLIDAGDNGMETYTPVIEDVFPYTAGAVISSFRPSWKKESDYSEEFMEAVTFARGLLIREIQYTKDLEEVRERVVAVYEETKDKSVIIFSEEDSFGRESINKVLSEYPEPIFAVLFRRDVNSWQVCAVPSNEGAYANRKSLPESWRGKRDRELDEATGVSGTLFCHRAGFMCVTKTKEAALMLVEKALAE